MIDLANLATTASTTAAEGAPNVASVAGIFEALLGRGDTDPAMRYWAVVGRGELDPWRPMSTELVLTLAENPLESPSVRLAAADAYFRNVPASDDDEAVLDVLVEMLGNENEWVRVMAANILDRIDDRAASCIPAMRAALEVPDGPGKYITRVMTHTLGDLEDPGKDGGGK
ncbi:MAG: HEAT repeat domain-containing protein [Pirellulales bacterium]